LDEGPIVLDKRKNHTIDVVVDRLVMKPGIEKRLEASIQTATKLTDGLVIVAVINGKERLYSQKLACPNCGRSVPQLEPRSFSFNSPYGACESCTGLGSKWSFDPEKVICDPSKPLLDGALGVGATAVSMLEQISQAGARLNLDLNVPFEKLPKKVQTLMLNGGPGFPGIMRLLLQRYENSSDAGREWLMEYMSPIDCEACAAASG
jgi:excinuclease ABC subunit A